MNWTDLLAAVALYLVLEGLLPFASPNGWRRSLEALSGLQDGQVRFIGLASIIAGLILLVIVRG